jgi:hypothetical protein
MDSFTDDSASVVTTDYLIGYSGTAGYRWTIASIIGLAQAELDLVKGTYTNTYLCTYTTAGTLLDCNTNPA